MAVLPADLRESVVSLYRTACHGAGADERWAARDALVALGESLGVDYFDLMRAADLDVAAFFASRPISRSRS